MTRRARELWTLGKYLALASSALTVLLTILLTAVIELTASRNVAADIGASLAELAGQMANRMDRALYERYREIQLMAARVDRRPDWDEVRAELDVAKGTYRFYGWLGATDADGTVRAASGRVLEGADLSQQRWWRNARAGVHLGPVHRAELPGQALRGPDGEAGRYFDVAFPLKEGGVLAAHVSWAWGSDTRNAVFGPSRRTGIEPLIVGSDGVVLLGPPDVEGKSLPVGSLAEAAGAARGYTVEKWPDGETYLVGYASTQGFLSSPTLGWRVLVRQDVGTAHAPLRAMQVRVLAWGATLAVLFSLVGWIAARAVTRPLLDLAGAARRMEQGEPVAVQPSRAYREVEVLGSALNAMLAAVREKTEQLRQLNAQLEQRVEQRTAELREAFERVRGNEQRIQTIIESAQDPFIGMDLQGRIVDWSTQAEVVFGWGREEVLGRSAELLLPPRYAPTLSLALAEFARTGTSPLLQGPVERTLVDRHGREIPVELRIGLVSTGRERFFTAFVHDISQRREVARLKDEFISTVSHELRTPLTAIYGALNLLASGAAGELPQEARQLLAISQESTERLIRLINDLLDLEKIASGMIEYRMQPQPLRPLVEQAVRDVGAYAEGQRVRLVFDPQADPVAPVDADRILQVCVNLLSNAVKFSPAGADVRVALEAPQGRARIVVADQGPGVPPEFQDRIFDRFAQADSSHRRAKGGTGLGLAICQSIVEAHGGRIGFTSEPNVRTEFFVELPLSPQAAAQNEVR